MEILCAYNKINVKTVSWLILGGCFSGCHFLFDNE